MDFLNFFEVAVLRTGDIFLVCMRLLGYVLTMTVSDFLDGFTWNFDSILFLGEGFSFTMPSLKLLKWVLNLIANVDKLIGFPLMETVQSFTVFNAFFVVGIILSAFLLIFGFGFKIVKLFV